MRKLGVVAEALPASPGDLQRFRATFAGPLSASKQSAINFLFGDGLEPVELDLDLGGLVDEA